MVDLRGDRTPDLLHAMQDSVSSQRLDEYEEFAGVS